MLATQTNISHLKPSFVILGEAKMRGIHSTFRCECVRKAVFETPLPDANLAGKGGWGSGSDKAEGQYCVLNYKIRPISRSVRTGEEGEGNISDTLIPLLTSECQMR